jgi:hypothetical protein
MISQQATSKGAAPGPIAVRPPTNTNGIKNK